MNYIPYVSSSFNQKDFPDDLREYLETKYGQTLETMAEYGTHFYYTEYDPGDGYISFKIIVQPNSINKHEVNVQAKDYESAFPIIKEQFDELRLEDKVIFYIKKYDPTYKAYNIPKLIPRINRRRDNY